MAVRRSRSVRGVTLLVAAAAAGGLTFTGSAQAVVGDAVAGGAYAFTAKIDVGGQRACTGALVDAQWVLTAASCFVSDPNEASPVPSGAPQQKTTAVIGRTDLSGTGGSVTEVVEVVPRADRDLVMARLAEPVTGIAPVRLASAAPVPGETLRAVGYGRTKGEWVPDRLHAGAFIVEKTVATTVAMTSNGGSICKGDAGGPALREKDGQVELVAIHSASWQAGCLGSDETRKSAVESRLDDIGQWVKEIRALPQESQVTAGDFNGDGKEDVTAFYDNGTSVDGKNMSSLHTFFSNGTGFKAPQKMWTSTGSFNWKAGKLTSGDYNGDGNDDVAVFYDSGTSADGKNMSSLFTFYSTGTGFKAPQKTWSTPGGFTWEAGKLTSGDYNGDGKDDIGVFYNRGVSADGKRASSLFTFTSDGTDFNAPREMWTSTGSFNWDASKLTSGDYNGDGKNDIAVFYDSGTSADGKNMSSLFTFYSTGTGFKAPQKTWSTPGGFTWEAGKLTSGDYNGDGKDGRYPLIVDTLIIGS
ncbi:FG-GAP-like repeat-containing protein [Streptomyces sp. A3M-1-3]|uniref:trypsin-like serine protease n=1 Tax=Streptomyces sp. A3M-1-3 TaxID=2962044 RepID=UPI0020B7BA61|nr:trypsin-like serine protease [Streptomyces sp. A3M-1-3]MCP3819229.1 FG-GAP-like repeat-containing protein [Streptomyces sp. A3M-1-3]